jgi:hypothetical protein
MSLDRIHRRQFLSRTAVNLGALSASFVLGCQMPNPPARRTASGATDAEDVPDDPQPKPPYKGPNVILIRFGGGIRRQESILEPEKTYCPFVYHELYEKRGILFNNVEIESAPGIETSHGQGTLFLLTGVYDHYENPVPERFEAKVPTIFEYFRKTYDIPSHQALVLSSEDRPNEEYCSYSNHHFYGVRYRSTVLSLRRYKAFLLKRALAFDPMTPRERLAKETLFNEMEFNDHRRDGHEVWEGPIDEFWDRWRSYYGAARLPQMRGDRFLTSVALRAMRELRPRLLMVNYQDPDYVHWGPPTFYTRAISVIDDGIRQIYEAVQNDPGDGGSHTYRDNTVFLIIPDCGRDNNACLSVPFQHHFGSRSAHEVFAIATGPGIARSRVPVDKLRQQISLPATVGAIMKFPTEHVQAGSFEEMIA